MSTEEKKVWTKEEIWEKIQNNDKVMYRALVRLYDLQTEDEKVSKETKEHNGQGFNGYDAEIMSSFAEFYKKTGFLTPKQKVIARKKLKKYTKQLTNIANA